MNMSTNGNNSSSNPVRANPFTGKSVTPTSNVGGNLGHTDFGPKAGTFKPIAPNSNLAQELQNNSKTAGSYGNYGQKTNPFNEPNPFGVQKNNPANSSFNPNSANNFSQSANQSSFSQTNSNFVGGNPAQSANNSIGLGASSGNLVSTFGANSDRNLDQNNSFSQGNLGNSQNQFPSQTPNQNSNFPNPNIQNPNNANNPNFGNSNFQKSNQNPQNTDNSAFQSAQINLIDQNIPNLKGTFTPNYNNFQHPKSNSFQQNSQNSFPNNSQNGQNPHIPIPNSQNSNSQNQNGQNHNSQHTNFNSNLPIPVRNNPNFTNQNQGQNSNQFPVQNPNQTPNQNPNFPSNNSSVLAPNSPTNSRQNTNQNTPNFGQNQFSNNSQNRQNSQNNFQPNFQPSQNPNSTQNQTLPISNSQGQFNPNQNSIQTLSIAQNPQNTQTVPNQGQIPNPNLQPKAKSGGLFGLFGKREEKVVVQQVLSKDSVEYLKQLSPSDLRKEVIKTEIEIQKALIENERAYRDGISTVRDLISPSGVKITHGYLELNTKLTRSFFILVYPRVINMGWLEGLVNADLQMDISIFIYPRDSADVLRDLKGKVAKIQASLQMNAEQGKTRDPALETAYRDVEGLRDAIQQGVEKFFRTGVYITVYGDTLDQLEKNSQAVEGVLSQQSIVLKRAALQMDDGFNASLPILKDDLDVVSNMNTGPLSACFPFVSSDLSSDSGILYGINRHNSSLIIFDRFELENANSLVFATSGAGKSFAVKLEILRSLMLGVGVIVIDPEQEYKVLADTLGGTYINMSLNSNNRINPFDLPKPLPGESTADIIRTAIIDLMGLMNLMMGKMSASEIGIMERAIKECYNKRDITDNSDLTKVQAPTMTDLVEILQGIVGGDSLAQRLYRYTEGTFSGLFNKPTNINMKNDFIVFNIRDLQDTLRPIAMYILLKYVWTEIRTSLKKRILAIDEAWIMMQYEDSARFLFSLAKRARKYYLGITTITQDVGDFLNSPLGKPIVTNAAMKILLKQSTAAIDGVAETFALTSGEKQVLLQSDVGQGIFFAGARHVAIEIIAFPTEHRLITTNPKDLIKIQEQDAQKK